MSAVMQVNFYNSREWTAKLGAVSLGLLILFLSQHLVMHEELVRVEDPISLTIVAPPEKPLPIIEEPVKQSPPPPKVERVVEHPKVIAPISEVPAPVAVPVPPVKPVIQAPVKEVKVAPPVLQSNAAAEGMFAQDVRTKIERKKIYPDTARDLGMSGGVEILYELDRSGNLIRAEIASSSGYKLLDQAALKAVKSANYKKFPDDAWIGESSKVFRTKLVFSINE